MDLFFVVSIFILGTLVGSFVNVVSLRHNTGLSIVHGRSKCFHCDRKLVWYELIPLVSFLFLSGKCRTCKNKISWQYPIVEFLLGVVFVGIILRQISLLPLYESFENGMMYSVLLTLYYFFIFSVLFVITIYDFRHKIIPNSLVYLFIFFSCLKLALFVYIKYPSLEIQDFFDILSPLILFTFFALLWLVSSGRWIGFGDVKLVFGIGALLGFVFGVGAVVLGFWLGAIWSVFLLINSKLKEKGKISMKTELPFAPFLITGTILVFLCRFDVMNLSAFFGS